MRRPGKRNLRDGPLKHDAVVRQRIEGWSLDRLRSITSHVIGAQGIDGDQYNAGFRDVRSSDCGAACRFCLRRTWLERSVRKPCIRSARVIAAAN